jgi:guanylate kinase
VVRRLLELRPDLAFSVSATTRSPRPGEVEGVHYRFVTDTEFDRLVREGAFLEWAEVFGHRYGTPWEPIAAELGRGRDVVLEVDVQGAAAVRARRPDAVLIFLVPPSEEELERRLRSRRTEDEADLSRRLAAAREEMAQRAWFHHVVVNDDVERAAREVAAIIEGP